VGNFTSLNSLHAPFVGDFFFFLFLGVFSPHHSVTELVPLAYASAIVVASRYFFASQH
jgi:hypothetical protein